MSNRTYLNAQIAKHPELFPEGIKIGRASIVGATVKRAEVRPPLTADEKHTRFKRLKRYLAVTAAKGCILGSQFLNCSIRREFNMWESMRSLLHLV